MSATRWLVFAIVLLTIPAIFIAILAGVSIICFLSIVPLLWKNGDRIYALLAITEVIILTVAASGIL